MAVEDLHGYFLFSIDVSVVTQSLPLEILIMSRAGLINMRIRVHIAYGLIAATYIATICSILFGCYPLHKNWQIYPNPGSTVDLSRLLRSLLTIPRSLPARRFQDRYLCHCRPECRH